MFFFTSCLKLQMIKSELVETLAMKAHSHCGFFMIATAFCFCSWWASQELVMLSLSHGVNNSIESFESQWNSEKNRTVWTSPEFMVHVFYLQHQNNEMVYRKFLELNVKGQSFSFILLGTYVNVHGMNNFWYFVSFSIMLISSSPSKYLKRCNTTREQLFLLYFA